MTGERFDSGGVLARATPVLTFATEVRVDAAPTKSPPESSAPARVRPRADTPTPGGMTTPLPPREAALPVIPRIVRRTRVDTDRAFLRPIGRAAKAAQRSSIGGIAIMALALATLGAVSGLGLRSLTDQALAPAATFEHTSDAAGVEHVLARASAAARQEGLAAASPPSTAPSPIAAPTPAAPTPVAASMASPSPSPGVPAPPASPSPAAHAAPRPTRAAHADAKVATSHPAARPLTPPHRSKHHASAALQARR